MTIAIIAARGGSKRLPRKNVRKFCGYPLIVWSIVQARCSHLISKVFVTTDDDEIEQISREWGAEVIRRPDWPNPDKIAANRPFVHAIETIGPQADTVLTILPTSPLNLPGDFDRGIEAYRAYGCDTIRPMREMRETEVHRKLNGWRMRNALWAKGNKYLAPGNNWVVCSPCWYLTMDKMLGTDLDDELNALAGEPGAEGYYFLAEHWQYADVDTAEEFELAEVIMEHFILKGRGMAAYEEYARQGARK